MINVWINSGSGWNVESIESQYINISAYRPLSGSFYMGLPVELRSPRKGLIKIKYKYQKYFLLCHVRHITVAYLTGCVGCGRTHLRILSALF